MQNKSIVTTVLGFVALIATTLIIVTANAQQRAPASDPIAMFSQSLTSVPDTATLTNEGAFYVPAFSSIRMEGGKTRLDLAVTLSVHNTSETKALVLNRIDYFDTSGTLVQHFLTQAIALRPFGTVEIFISRDDVRGGNGANFLVAWAAAGPIAEPLTETVMMGSVGTNSYSFATQGRAIRVVPAKTLQ